MTGSFSRSQDSLLSLLESHGGTIVDSVSRKCTHLIAEAIGSTKTKKAQQNGIPIVTERWIEQSIADGKPSNDRTLYLSVGGGEDSSSSSIPPSVVVPESIRQRVIDLRAELTRANSIYYGSDKSSGLTDEQYDQLFRELEKHGTPTHTRNTAYVYSLTRNVIDF